MADPIVDGSITLMIGSGVNGKRHPITLDWKLQLDKFLRERLPVEDVLFARWPSYPPINPLACGNAPEYLKPPYPPLPPIKVGELQWPSGVSRFARALYAVDRLTLEEIAKALWGWAPTVVEGVPRPLPLSDIPAEWSNESTKIYDDLELVIANLNNAAAFRCRMFALPPYRVTPSGAELWLLPLVDARWVNLHKVHDSTDTAPADWEDLMDDLAVEIGITSVGDVVSIDYGSPSTKLYETKQPQLAANLFDLSALSTGRRVVVEPLDGSVYVINQANSEIRRKRRFGYTYEPETMVTGGAVTEYLIAGGYRGKGAVPTHVDVYLQDDGSVTKESAAVAGGNTGYLRLPVWTDWQKTTDNATETTAFVEQIATDVSAWMNCGGQYCFAGPLDSNMVQVNGYDDFLSIELFECEPEKYIFRTRCYELPPIFLPIVILAGGSNDSNCGGGESRFFTLLEDVIGGGLQRVWALPSTESAVTSGDPVKVTSWLGTIEGAKAGYTGLFTRVDNQWVFDQGPCFEPCETEGTIDVGDPDDAVVGEGFEHTITVSGLTGGLTYDDLPASFSTSGASNNVITGTPGGGDVGTHYVIVTGVAPSSAEGADPEDTCTITRVLVITIVEAPEE